MTGKMIPVSIRIPEKDAAFLAQLDVDGATTLSEKVRALIGEARRRREAGGFASEAVRNLEDIHLAQDRQRRAQEQSLSFHSELVSYLSHWLLETHIACLTQEDWGGDPDEVRGALEQYEASLADQIFVLMDQMLRMGLTTTSRCYNPHIVSGRMEALKELIAIYNKD